MTFSHEFRPLPTGRYNVAQPMYQSHNYCPSVAAAENSDERTDLRSRLFSLKFSKKFIVIFFVRMELLDK